MSYGFPPNVQSLIDAHMATGRFASEEDVLREALTRLAQDEDDDFDLVKEALDAMASGDQGTPLDEAIAQVREQVARRP